MVANPSPRPAAADTHQDGLPVPRRYFSVLAIWLALFMAVLDSAIANVALPTIAADMRASPAASIWIVNAYQLAITVCLLPLAALGDKIGYRRVYLTGLGVFTVGSLACALSHSLAGLTAARVFQGLGAAGIMSINAALVRFTYPQATLGRGIGLNALVISISAALGPTVASGILAVAAWQWLFAINVPIGVLAIGIGLRALPKTVGSGKRFDWNAAGLSALTFGFFIMGAESIAREGLGVGLMKLAVGVAAALFLIPRELHERAPLLPLDLMRIPIFGLSILTSIVSFAAQMMAYVALPFFFQGPLGRSAVETGLLMTPWPLAVGVTAPLAGRLADKISAGVLGGIGLFVFGCGLASLAVVGPHPDDLQIVWRMALCGAGFGLFQSPNNRALVSSAPRERSGAAGGMLATARLLGQTGGAVMVGVYFQLVAGQATRLALATAAAVALLAAGVSILRLRISGRPTPAAAPADAAIDG